jgi:hypothetical protein
LTDRIFLPGQFLSFANTPAGFKISKILQGRVTCYMDEFGRRTQLLRTTTSGIQPSLRLFGCLQQEIAVNPNPGTIIQFRQGSLRTTVFVPWLQVEIQFTKIHLIKPLGKEFFRSNENCRQNCLIKWLKV